MRPKRTPDARKELLVLQLIATGLDVRQQVDSRELRRLPSLRRALSALDELQAEIGWGEWEVNSGAKRKKKA
jgi:hypothetical protein